MTDNVSWYGHVLRMEGGNVLKRALQFEVEGHWKKWRPKRTWEKQVEEKSMKLCWWVQNALCISSRLLALSKLPLG